jgi:hypothetical protein
MVVIQIKIMEKDIRHTICEHSKLLIEWYKFFSIVNISCIVTVLKILI